MFSSGTERDGAVTQTGEKCCHGAAFSTFTAGKCCGLQLMKSGFEDSAW